MLAPFAYRAPSAENIRIRMPTGSRSSISRVNEAEALWPKTKNVLILRAAVKRGKIANTAVRIAKPQGEHLKFSATADTLSVPPKRLHPLFNPPRAMTQCAGKQFWCVALSSGDSVYAPGVGRAPSTLNTVCLKITGSYFQSEA